MKPITKVFLLFATLLILFISSIFLINKTFKNIKTSSDKVEIYNDSILTIKGEFNKYLIYDDININSLNKANYIENSNRNLKSLNNYIKSKEIKYLTLKKELYIKSVVIKNYKIKESYGVINYKITKGIWLFKKTTVKQITYKKIDRKEIDNLNKTELSNKEMIDKYHINNDKINRRLNEIVTNKIDDIQLEKVNILKSNNLETKNIFSLLVIITTIAISTIIIILLSIIKDIKNIMRKHNMDKVTLSFLVNYIKENKIH